MAEKTSKEKRADADRKLSQKAFENKVDKEMKGVVRATDRMAQARSASAIDLSKLADAKVDENFSGEKALMAESRAAKTKPKEGK